MRKRAHALGAQLELKSTPSGTTLTLHIPRSAEASTEYMLTNAAKGGARRPVPATDR
jgi:signal transduction histidine kinase